MFTIMSGTVRVSGGLLHCNMTYMPIPIRTVKSLLLRCNKKFENPAFSLSLA